KDLCESTIAGNIDDAISHWFVPEVENDVCVFGSIWPADKHAQPTGRKIAKRVPAILVRYRQIAIDRDVSAFDTLVFPGLVYSIADRKSTRLNSSHLVISY